MIKRIIKKIAVLAAIAGIICIAAAVVFKTFKIKNIEVEGSDRYTAEEIEKYIINDVSDETVFMLYLKNKFADQKSIPFIESYEVSITGKNSVKVKLYEKMVIGCAEVMGSYMYFDREGIIVESSKEWDKSVPVINGLLYDEIVLYQPLNIQKKELFNTILEVSRLISKYELDVSSINFSSSYEITLVVEENEFLLGKRDTYDIQISNIENILLSIGNEKLRIDMRNFSEKNQSIIAEPLK